MASTDHEAFDTNGYVLLRGLLEPEDLEPGPAGDSESGRPADRRPVQAGTVAVSVRSRADGRALAARGRRPRRRA